MKNEKYSPGLRCKCKRIDVLKENLGAKEPQKQRVDQNHPHKEQQNIKHKTLLSSMITRIH